MASVQYVFVFASFVILNFQIRLSTCNSLPVLTLEDHKISWEFLEKVINYTYPSDDVDTSEIVSEEVNENHGVIYYNLEVEGNSKPAFVSVGTKNTGKKVVVLLRGDDYLDPMNKERFVVLRKRSSGEGEYNVHLAVIWRDAKQQRYANWENVQIAFETNVRRMINYVTQQYLLVEPFYEGSIRPLCGWFGVVLLCDSEEKLVGRGSGDVESIIPPLRKQRVHKVKVTSVGQSSSSSSSSESRESSGQGGSSPPASKISPSPSPSPSPTPAKNPPPSPKTTAPVKSPPPPAKIPPPPTKSPPAPKSSGSSPSTTPTKSPATPPPTGGSPSTPGKAPTAPPPTGKSPPSPPSTKIPPPTTPAKSPSPPPPVPSPSPPSPSKSITNTKTPPPPPPPNKVVPSPPPPRQSRTSQKPPSPSLTSPKSPSQPPATKEPVTFTFDDSEEQQFFVLKGASGGSGMWSVVTKPKASK